MLEDLESGNSEYEIAKKFLVDLKKEFGEDKKAVKVVELRKLEQGERTIEEFVQEFKRAARRSSYEERLLIEEFKREMSRMIRRKLIKTERPPTSIKQWYEYATNLDRYQRESKREEKKLREKKENKNTEQREKKTGRNQEGFRL